MTDGDALFRAVCVSPADDLPRLVYADWVEEHGDADRAAFIRLQCDLYRRPADDPDTPALRRQEADLLRAHRADWAKELPVLRGVEWSSLWVRGFVDAVLVNGGTDFVAGRDALFATPITRLTVTPLRRPDVAAVLGSTHLRRLGVLRLPGSELDDSSAALLARCDHLVGLRELDLTRNEITDRGVFLLLQSPHLHGLRRLVVEGNPVRTWPQRLVDEALRLRAVGGPVG